MYLVRFTLQGIDEPLTFVPCALEYIEVIHG